MTSLFDAIKSAIIYLGIGAFFHLLFVGASIDWHSALTWMWLFGWPVMLVLLFWGAILLMIGIAFLIAGIAFLVEKLRAL